MVMVKATGIWLLMAAAVTANGFVRDWALTPRLGEGRARRVSTLTACLLVLVLAWLLVPLLGLTGPIELLGVGLYWVGLAVGFELAVGRLWLGRSWAWLLRDYDVLHGHWFPLLLLALLLAPLIAMWLHVPR